MMFKQVRQIGAFRRRKLRGNSSPSPDLVLQMQKPPPFGSTLQVIPLAWIEQIRDVEPRDRAKPFPGLRQNIASPHNLTQQRGASALPLGQIILGGVSQ